MNDNLNRPRPIFIVGMPRSGTTLISSIISAHPNITIPSSETKFLCNWVKDNSPLNKNYPSDFASFWEEYSRSDRFSYLGIDTNAALERILTTGKYDYKEIFTGVLQEYASKMKKPRWGEKTPQHCRYVDLLLEWYPQARIIWMLRDPRAVTNSLMAAPWGVNDAVVHATSWRKNIISLEKWSEDQRVKILKYEKLLTQPESTLRELCEFINEKYFPAMLNRSETSSPIINRTGWELKHLQNTLKPVNKASLNKWRSNLSENQISMVEYITKDKMRKYGYQQVTSGVKLIPIARFYLKKVLRKIEHFNKIYLDFYKVNKSTNQSS